MATHSRVLAWRIPGTGEPGGLPSMGHTESDMTEATLQQQPLCNFLGSKITAVVTGAMKSKDAYFLEEKL